MEAFEGVVVGELKDPSHEIIEDERTKRETPSSPILFTIASPQLASGEGGGYNANEENIVAENKNNNNNNNTNEENASIENNNNNNDKEENITPENNNKVNSNHDNNNKNQSNSTNLKLTPAGSSNDVNSTTAEDEDTARLLILLSQGNSRESPTQQYYLDRNYSPPSTKFSSKKYIETSSNVDGRSGMFVYECKTCNRTFPSFQALGGHRASHRKPKNLTIEELKKRPFSSVFSDDYDYDFNPSSSLSRNNNNYTMRRTATSRKTHECSYCGAEFTSGQALGGHMRRHRGSNGNNNSNYNPNNNINNNIYNTQPLLALSPSLMSSLSVNQDSIDNKKQRTDNDNKDALSLSLSLSFNPSSPPPAENYQKHQESTDIEFIAEKIPSPSPEKQHEQQEQEQTGNKETELLVSTKPTLVDCHN